MDGDQAAPKEMMAPDVRSQLHPLMRCGWCGLLPLPEERSLIRHTQLCGACFDILSGADWRSLLNECSEARRN